MSCRTRRTKNFVRLHVLSNTAVYRYDMEVDIHSKTLVCFQTDIFWSLFMPADSLVEFLPIPFLLEQLHLKAKQLQPQQAIIKRHCCKAKLGRVIAQVCDGQTIRKKYWVKAGNIRKAWLNIYYYVSPISFSTCTTLEIWDVNKVIIIIYFIYI